MQLFFNPELDLNHPTLPEEEARHGIKVLRMGIGDTLHLTDGKGNLYTTRIESTDPKKCRLSIVNTQSAFGKRNYSVHIAVAPTKNADRTEWLVEKCVEFGVDQISFIACERSERKFFKTDRLEKIAVAAMKQSLKAYLPQMNGIVSFKDFVKKPHSGQTFIAHLEEGKRDLLQHIAQKEGQYCVLIGPEGDFSPSEVQQALAVGFAPVSLGPSRLRTETAGVAACHIINLVNW